MRRTKLIVDYELGARIIGIVTALKDYKLAWSINQLFSINLAMQPSLKLEFIKGEDLSIVNFIYQTEVCQIQLIKNKGIEENSGFLIPELSNFDFFLMFKDENEEVPEQEVDKLTSMRDIVFCKKIDVLKVKSKDNFIF